MVVLKHTKVIIKLIVIFVGWLIGCRRLSVSQPSTPLFPTHLLLGIFKTTWLQLFKRWIALSTGKNHYPLDNSIGFASVYPLDSDLSSGQCYPSFEQLGPERHLTVARPVPIPKYGQIRIKSRLFGTSVATNRTWGLSQLIGAFHPG